MGVGGALGLIPTHIAAYLQQAGRVLGTTVLPRKVGSGHAAGDDAATAAPATTETAAREAAVIDIVAAAYDGELIVIHKAMQVGLERIAVLGAASFVEIEQPALLCALLQGEVEHGLLFAIIYTRDARVVALAVVGLELLHHLGGQVLHGHLGVVVEELLALDHYLAHGLAVYLDGAVFVHLGTGQLLHQLLER